MWDNKNFDLTMPNGHPRIKQKNVLWSGDLKASLRIAAKKSIRKTSSITTT